MGDRIVAEFAALEEAAAGFGRVLQALQRQLADLDRDLQASLVRWEGDAARAYWIAHGEWQAAADDMAERLAALHRVIVTARRHYGVSLKTNVTMWHVV
jgi:WXG100 family type VII secretion target